MSEKEIVTFYPGNAQQWRAWLEKHHASEQSVWLICYKQQAGIPTISWSEAVDEALCFGWIDSTRKTLDAEKFIQFFTRRKAGSTWSKVNKEKVAQLIADGRMTAAGLASITRAQENGSWTILDEVEALLVPADLQLALDAQEDATAFFLGLSKSARKMLLQWIVMAKRPETRQKRIAEIAECAAQHLKPPQFR